MANEAVPATSKKSKGPKSKSKPLNEEKEPLAKSVTGSSVNEVLQQAYIESQNEGKKKKKSKVHKDMTCDETGSLLDRKLESLKKGDGIRKDSDDSLLLANTYDPDEDPKNKKSNKNRQKEQRNKLNGIENTAFTEENEIPPRKPRRKSKKHDEENTQEKSLTIEQLAPPATQKTKSKKAKEETASEAETLASPHGKTQKKKKKKHVEDDQVVSEGTERDDTSRAVSDAELGQSKVKKKKKKKKKEETQECNIIEDHGRIVGLSVHRTDKLKTDFLIAHPVVRVSVVDNATGNYLKKQHEGRQVTSYYEHDNVNFILPIMTLPFDFKHNKSTLPVWEELLIFNENYDYFIQEDPSVIMFFEILDFMSMNAATQRQSSESGWHRIAWGFLKLVGANGKPNTDKKLRLQLYQPLVRFRARSDQLEVYQWYKSRNMRLRYPSTLYVTVKGIIPPETIEPAPRSMFATQEERGRVPFDEMQKTLDGTLTTREGRTIRGPSLWTRLAGQLCKIPNDRLYSLPGGNKGCYVVRFSLDGKHLACGCRDRDGYPIVIYEVLSGKAKGQLHGHFGIIYDICWSRNHTEILTASGDGTARVWDTDKMISCPLKTLPHPSFVYSAKYHPRVNKIVVTGGYDRMIRIWTLKGDEPHGQLLQELDDHVGVVNTLCFDFEGTKLYSGDSVGEIKAWTVYVTDKPSSTGMLHDWVKEKDISEPEIKGVVINVIKMHTSGRRILIHTRDNQLRLYDLRIGAVMQRYKGSLSFREHIRSTMTPCGSFVFAGSEDSCVYVWNSDSGDQVAQYNELGYRQPVSDVDYHPHDHIVAFCSFGEHHPVILYKYDHLVAQRDLGIEPADGTRMQQKTRRPMSPEIKAGVEPKSDDEALETALPKTGDVDLDVSHSARLERARRKLNSVLAFQSGTYQPPSPGHPLGIQPATSTVGTSALSWATTFDSSMVYPQTQSLATDSNAWRPGFTDVGRHGSPSPFVHPPVGITAVHGKPQLQVYGRKHTKDWMVALYDYQAQRSDELTFARGDDLWIICKDTDSWWLARNAMGEEGYIPSNYVTSHGEEKNELAAYEVAVSKDAEDESDEDVRKSRTTAVVSKSGELKFISATEDSDVEPQSRRKKRKKKVQRSQGPHKSQDTVINIDSEPESGTLSHDHRMRWMKTPESMA